MKFLLKHLKKFAIEIICWMAMFFLLGFIVLIALVDTVYGAILALLGIDDEAEFQG